MFFLILLLIFPIFLFSCQVPVKEMDGASNTTEIASEIKEKTSEISPDNLIVDSKESLPSSSLPSSTSPSSTQCTDGWVCLTSTQKLHRLANCSFAEREICKFGCVNDSCQPAPVCTSGFKCKSKYEKGYQLEDCSWMSRSKCEFGCENAVCIEKSNVTENNPSSQTSSPAPPSAPSYPIIALGEKKVITVDDKEYNLSIYILEPDQVKLQLDSFKSNWIPELGNYTFGSVGVNIFVRGIFFQSFEGGKKEVTYEVK
ncbi:hypothetical protein HYX13_00750 [Candidatus Woesearchaeota archaeon]|nr:hypothetical protein [Candidatus Woesearchaeota archaeon]